MDWTLGWRLDQQIKDSSKTGLTDQRGVYSSKTGLTDQRGNL